MGTFRYAFEQKNYVIYLDKQLKTTIIVMRFHTPKRIHAFNYQRGIKALYAAEWGKEFSF